MIGGDERLRSMIQWRATLCTNTETQRQRDTDTQSHRHTDTQTHRHIQRNCSLATLFMVRPSASSDMLGIMFLHTADGLMRIRSSVKQVAWKISYSSKACCSRAGGGALAERYASISPQFRHELLGLFPALALQDLVPLHPLECDRIGTLPSLAAALLLRNNRCVQE